MSGYTYNRGYVRGGQSPNAERSPERELARSNPSQDPQKCADVNTADYESLYNDYQHALDTIAQLKGDLAAANNRIEELEDEIAKSAPCSARPDAAVEAQQYGSSARTAPEKERPHAHFEDIPQPLHVGNLDKKYWGESQPAENLSPKRSSLDTKYWGESNPQNEAQFGSPRRTGLDSKYWGESQQQPEPTYRRAMRDSNIFGESPERATPKQVYGRRRQAPNDSDIFNPQGQQSVPTATTRHYPGSEDSDIFGQNPEKSTRPATDERSFGRVNEREPVAQEEQEKSPEEQLKALEREKIEIDRKLRASRPIGVSMATFRREQGELEERLDQIEKERSRLRLQVRYH